MPIDMRDLRSLDGPNLYYSQAGVKLQVWSDRDIRREISDSVKGWAQMTGLVIGYLEQTVNMEQGGQLITTTWTTPLPSVGARIAEAVVADLQAAEQGDEEYSHDDILFEIIRMRKREEPPLALLQLYAEARVRDLPFLPREDGTIMIGSGARGHIIDPSGLSLGLTLEIPWDTVGRIPVVAVTGGGGAATARLIASVLEATGRRVGLANTDTITIDGKVIERGDQAGFGGARRVLTDPQVEIAVLETSARGILQRGLGFDMCDLSVITTISRDQPVDIDIDMVDDLTRANEVVALATRPDGHVVLNADNDHVAALKPYVRANTMWITRDLKQAQVRVDLEAGGDVVWSDGDSVQIAIEGARAEFPLASIPVLGETTTAIDLENVLAATAACTALDVPAERIRDALRVFGRGTEE